MKFTIIIFTLFTMNIFASDSKDQRLKNVFKSSTLAQIKCKSEKLKIVAYKHVTFEKFATFTWTAQCGLKTYSCSGTENGPICIKN